MKQFVFLVLLAISLVSAKGQGAVIMQDKAFVYQHKKDTVLLGLIREGPAYLKMSLAEKDVVYWINFMRNNPEAFRTDLLKPFLSQFPELQSSAARSLDKELASSRSMSVLLPALNLNKAALMQANYLAETQQFSHIGPKGKSFKVRMEEAGVRQCAGENLFNGKADPLVSLMLLLIDQGVAGYGHREALLNTSFNRVGVGAISDGGETMIMVQVFSCE